MSVSGPRSHSNFVSGKDGKDVQGLGCAPCPVSSRHCDNVFPLLVLSSAGYSASCIPDAGLPSPNRTRAIFVLDLC